MKPHVSDPATSVRMAGVRQKGTNIELLVGAALRGLGLHYRKNVKRLPGSPDFANQKRRWAIFVNGCFWHHHTGCRKATVPKTNGEFWTAKFKANRRRDASAVVRLRAMGYQVVIIWECDRDHSIGQLGKVLESRRVNSR